MILDAAAGGTMMDADAEQATRIITSLVATDRQAQHNRRPIGQMRGMMELNTAAALLAQNKVMTQQIEALSKQMANLLPQQMHAVNQNQQQILQCDFCGGNHQNGCCYEEEQAQFISNQNQQNEGNFSNFQQGWRNNPNQGQGWRNEGPPNRPPYQQ